MIEPTATQLKVLVERAVRPVQAGILRKMQMREELLAHVTAVFEEELAKHSDDRVALQRTTERFGDPAELTVQLQNSVSRASYLRSYWDAWVGCPPESFTARGAAGCAFRVSLMTAALTLLLLAPIMQWKGEVATMWLTTGLVTSAFAFGFVFLSLWMHFAMSHRLWSQGVAVVILSGLLVPGMTLGLCWVISADVAWSFRMALWQLPAALILMPLPVIGMSYILGHEIRAQREWSTLAVD